MKKFVVSIVEGILVGIGIAIAMRVLDIEATAFQASMLAVSAMIITSLASSIAQMVSSGKAPVFYEWVYMYGDNRIAVATGVKETLYINDELVAEKKGVSLSKVELSSKLKSGEEVKAVIIGGLTTKCELYVGNELLEPVATKAP